MKSLHLKLLSLVLALFVFTLRANAQMGGPPPPPHQPSLELLAANSKTIVTGTVSDFQAEPNQWEPREIKISVTETLKGSREDSLILHVERPVPEVARWMKSSAQLLIALPAGEGLVTIINLSDPHFVAFNNDLDRVRSADQVLKYLRARVRLARGSPPAGVFSLSAPIEWVSDSDWGKPYAEGARKRWGHRIFEIEVPVDSHLETWGRKEIGSKEAEMRVQGVNALSNFKSNENIALLTPLLSDPGFHVSSGAEGGQGTEGRVFDVRRAVFETLHGKWHLNVEEPVTLQVVSMLDTVQSIRLWNPITELALTWLQQAKKMKSLELYSDRTFSAQEVQLVGQLTGLNRLVLSGVGIDDTELKSLKGLTNLQSLTLWANPITDEGLKTIAEFQNLKAVDVTQCHTTYQGIVALRRARPDLKITPQVPAFLEDNGAPCARQIYVLTPSDVSHWSNENIGLNGPLQWSRTPSGRDYLGPFGQQAVTLKLSNIPKHKNVHIEIDLFVIDSWDGDGRLGAGPDVIDIQIPGVGTALHSTFFNNTEGDAAKLPAQSFPDPYPFGAHVGYTGAAEVRSLKFSDLWMGYTNHRDAVYKLHYTFTNVRSELQIVFTGQNVVQGGITKMLDDETWGIGKLVVKTD